MIEQLFRLELPDAFISILLAYYFLTFKIFAVRYALMQLSARSSLIAVRNVLPGLWVALKQARNFSEAGPMLYDTSQRIWLNQHNLRI